MERIWIKFWIKLLAVVCEFAIDPCTHVMQLPKEDTTRGAPLADMLNNSVVFQLVVISAKRRVTNRAVQSIIII